MPSAVPRGGVACSPVLPPAPSVQSEALVVPWWQRRLGVNLQGLLPDPSSVGMNEELGWEESLRDYDSDFLAL